MGEVGSGWLCLGWGCGLCPWNRLWAHGLSLGFQDWDRDRANFKTVCGWELSSRISGPSENLRIRVFCLISQRQMDGGIGSTVHQAATALNEAYLMILYTPKRNPHNFHRSDFYLNFLRLKPVLWAHSRTLTKIPFSHKFKHTQKNTRVISLVLGCTLPYHVTQRNVFHTGNFPVQRLSETPSSERPQVSQNRVYQCDPDLPRSVRILGGL